MKKEFWAVEDRPREKLKGKGGKSLTDLELIAGILETGTATDHVLDVAKKTLDALDSDLRKLVVLPISELQNIHGVGEAKAIRLKLVAELAHRLMLSSVPKKIMTSSDAFQVFAPSLGGDLPHEEFWMALLNRQSKLIWTLKVSQGGLNSTGADPRIIFSKALDFKASSIIVAHNHPSGEVNPSQADIALTKKLKGGAELLDIQLVDHLIISGNKYCSFADSGLL